MAEPTQDWRPRTLLHQGVSEHCGGEAGRRGTKQGWQSASQVAKDRCRGRQAAAQGKGRSFGEGVIGSRDSPT